MLKEPIRDRHLPPSRQDPQRLRSPLSQAWQQVDEFRARRKELGDWPDWCFLPLAGTYAIVSKGKTSVPNQAHHIGILGALAAWRVTQGIYRFDPTTFDALWKTPVTGDIPTEVLFHLPEWCVYIPTPDQTWQGATLNGFFAHLECDMNDRRTELRLVLDVTGAAGDDLIVMPIHLGKGGVAGGVAAMLKEAARHFPVRVRVTGRRVGAGSPATSRPWYRWSSTSAPRPPRSRSPVPGSVCPLVRKPQKTKKGMRIFPPGSAQPLGGRVSPRGCVETGVVGARTSDHTGTHASPRPHIRRAHWHSFWVGQEGPA